MIIVMDHEDVHGSCRLNAEDDLGGCDSNCLKSQGIEYVENTVDSQANAIF